MTLLPAPEAFREIESKLVTLLAEVTGPAYRDIDRMTRADLANGLADVLSNWRYELHEAERRAAEERAPVVRLVSPSGPGWCQDDNPLMRGAAE